MATSSARTWQQSRAEFIARYKAQQAAKKGQAVPQALAPTPTSAPASATASKTQTSGNAPQAPTLSVTNQPPPQIARSTAGETRPIKRERTEEDHTLFIRTSPGRHSPPSAETTPTASAALQSFKIPKRTRPAPPASVPSSATPPQAVSSPQTSSQDDKPAWYIATKIDPKARGEDRALESRLRKIRHLIGNVKNLKDATTYEFRSALDAVRQEIHELALQTVTAQALRRARMFEPNEGLDQIFDIRSPYFAEYPWDIKADAKELHNRWYQGIFDPDMFRGFKFKAANGKNTLVPDETYVKANSNYFGNGFLVNGQWWPNQLCGLRDGAHGSPQGGIHGKKGEGAYSIVLSGDHYEDRDEGEEIWYCGTDGKDYHVTESTQRMIESTGSDKPVRVLRSENLPDTNKYKPIRGYRYDGLYDVLDYKVLNKEKQAHLFHLRRRAGQDPIRCAGVESRPTPEEVAKYEQIRKDRGLTV